MNTEEIKEFIPAPEGMLYATWDKNYKLIIENQVDAFEKGIKPVAYEFAENGHLYVLGHAPKKTPKEKAEERIEELKRLLEDKDYWTSKHADGEYTEEEWAEKVAIRKAWRKEIAELEKICV